MYRSIQITKIKAHFIFLLFQQIQQSQIEIIMDKALSNFPFNLIRTSLKYKFIFPILKFFDHFDFLIHHIYFIIIIIFMLI